MPPSFAFASVVYPNFDDGTCDPSFPAAPVPLPGNPACVAYIAGEYTLTGDLAGNEVEEDSLVGWPEIRSAPGNAAASSGRPVSATRTTTAASIAFRIEFFIRT